MAVAAHGTDAEAHRSADGAIRHGEAHLAAPQHARAAGEPERRVMRRIGLVLVALVGLVILLFGAMRLSWELGEVAVLRAQDDAGATPPTPLRGAGVW